MLKVLEPGRGWDFEKLQKWFTNLLIFSSPALIVFLQSLASGDDLQIAAKLLYVAGINALIDFLKKYKATE